MAADYTDLDTEVLGRMVKAARQNKGASKEQFDALQRAVDERKKQLTDRLSQRQNEADKKVNILKELIALEPDNYKYYLNVGKCCYHSLDDHHTAVAYYTAALQLVDEDPDKVWEIYHYRSRAFFRLEAYESALADAKMDLHLVYLSKKYGDSSSSPKSYHIAMLCEILRQLGNEALAEELDTTYTLAELSNEGVTNESIEEHFFLLNIPIDTQSTTQVPQAVRTNATLSHMSRLKQQLSTDPVEVKKRHLRKQFYNERGTLNPDFSLLIRLIQELINLAPTDYRYLATLGALYFWKGNQNYAQAIPLLKKALEPVGDPGGQEGPSAGFLFDVHWMLAYAYKQERDFSAAIKHYALAIRACPEAEDSIGLLGLIVECACRRSYGRQARAMEYYFSEIQEKKTNYKYSDIKACLFWEELWEGLLGKVCFFPLSKLGIEENDDRVRRETRAVLDSLTSAQEKAEKEQQQAQQQAQQAAETLKNLDMLLRLMYTR